MNFCDNAYVTFANVDDANKRETAVRYIDTAYSINTRHASTLRYIESAKAAALLFTELRRDRHSTALRSSSASSSSSSSSSASSVSRSSLIPIIKPCDDKCDDKCDDRQ